MANLIDGAEVEIVAWVPRGSATRYLVRATHTEVSGWLGAASLRTTRAPRSAEAATKPSAAAVWIAPQPASASRSKPPRRAARASGSQSGRG